jgi:transcription-repair coupling factor (superfamily II helicase)
VAGSDRKTQRTLEKLSDTVLGLSAKLTLSRLRNKQLGTALRQEQKKKKRQKKVFEELRSAEGFGTLIMSPTRIQRARDLAMSKEQEKEQLVRDRELRAQERAMEKARKQEEMQQRREDRAVASASRKTAAAEKKAARAKEKADRMALKQLETQSSVSVRRRRGRPKKQTAAEIAKASPVKGIVEERTKQPVTRRGRKSRLSARYDN